MSQSPRLLNRAHAALAVIDIQEKLADQMKFRQLVIEQTAKLIEAANVLSVPVLLTEQYPKGLGPTVAEVAEKAQGVEKLEKLSFSSCGRREFAQRLREWGRHQIVLVGMETHVCIQQTALDLLTAGFAVYVPADAVCSRRSLDWRMGVAAMREAGVTITTTESAIFQLLRRAGTPEFKALLPLMK